MSPNRLILLFLDDLFFSVKLEAVARRQGFDVRTVSREADFAQALQEATPALAVVNLGMQGVDVIAQIEAAHQAGVPVLAFGPHVEHALHQAAREAGAYLSVANSRLMREWPALLQSFDAIRQK